MVADPLTFYNAEKLASYTLQQLKNLRDNASRKGQSTLADRCSIEIQSRAVSRKVVSKTKPRDSDDYVAGYHFVCADDRGVIVEHSGRFWTGSWVVAATKVETSLVRGAYVALHAAKNIPSYRQGTIVGWRQARRAMIDKENLGIEFLAQSTPQPIDWVGDGAGEKGYCWSRLVIDR